MDLSLAEGASGLLVGVATESLAEVVRAAMRHAPLLILLVLQYYAVGVGAFSEAEETNCSKAMGFNESMVPMDRSRQDLLLCNEHHQRTCCEKNHTRQVLSRFAPFSHERSGKCAQISRLALCSFCDSDVGTGAKTRTNAILLCPSFCETWYRACAEDYFAPGGSNGELTPCLPGSLVCSPLREISAESSRFCEGVGFAVGSGEDEHHDLCYDGVPGARSHGKGERASWVRPRPATPPWWKLVLQGWQQFRFPSLRELGVPRKWEAYVPAVFVGAVGIVILLVLLRCD